MKVFSACLKITRRRAGEIVLYLLIFLMLSILLTTFTAKQETTSFEETKPLVSVINRDKSSIIVNGLTDYLSEKAELVELPDEKEALQDALFYEAVNYILIIPDGFTEKFGTTEEIPMETAMVPNTSTGYYTDSLINQYMNTAHLYLSSLPQIQEQEWIQSVKDDVSAQVTTEMKQYGTADPLPTELHIFFRFLCYIMMILVILSTSTIMMVFNRPDLRMRNLCVPIPFRKVNFQMALCIGLVGLLCFIAMTGFGFLLYMGQLSSVNISLLILLLLNGLAFTIICFSVAFFTGLFVTNSSTQNAVTNFCALGLSFLGGAFVPLEMMGEGLLNVAHFVPNYWYISTLDRIAALTRFDMQTLSPIFSGMLVQFGFAAAIFCVALLVSKKRRQSNRGFGSIRTEIE